jgi:hypothetical protein
MTDNQSLWEKFLHQKYNEPLWPIPNYGEFVEWYYNNQKHTTNG